MADQLCLYTASVMNFNILRRNSRVERMIYRPPLHHCVAIAGDVTSTSSNYNSGVEVGFDGVRVLWQTRRSLALPAVHMGKK
eukprot:superscaffoldBa00010607_g24795